MSISSFNFTSNVAGRYVPTRKRPSAAAGYNCLAVDSSLDAGENDAASTFETIHLKGHSTLADLLTCICIPKKRVMLSVRVTGYVSKQTRMGDI